MLRPLFGIAELCKLLFIFADVFAFSTTVSVKFFKTSFFNIPSWDVLIIQCRQGFS